MDFLLYHHHPVIQTFTYSFSKPSVTWYLSSISYMPDTTIAQKIKWMTYHSLRPQAVRILVEDYFCLLLGFLFVSPFYVSFFLPFGLFSHFTFFHSSTKRVQYSVSTLLVVNQEILTCILESNINQYFTRNLMYTSTLVTSLAWLPCHCCHVF